MSNMSHVYVSDHTSHQTFNSDGSLKNSSEFFIVSDGQQDRSVIVQNNTMLCNCANVQGPCEHKACVAKWMLAQSEDPQRDAWLEREVARQQRPTERQVYAYQLMLRRPAIR
jgi:hypothetical protein